MERIALDLHYFYVYELSSFRLSFKSYFATLKVILLVVHQCVNIVSIGFFNS